MAFKGRWVVYLVAFVMTFDLSAGETTPIGTTATDTPTDTTPIGTTATDTPTDTTPIGTTATDTTATDTTPIGTTATDTTATDTTPIGTTATDTTATDTTPIGTTRTRTTTALTTTTAVERRCTLQFGQDLIMFNREIMRVRVPCKYRMADFTCGDYRVKVTPGSAVDAQARYFQDTAWVKVVNLVTKETVKLRTSLRRLAEAGTIDNVWKIKEGNSSFVDFAGYNGRAAVLEKEGVFSVQFSNNSVQVSCAAPDFSSRGVPDTLCGVGSTRSELWTAYQAMFGNSTLGLTEIGFVQYIVLNDTTVTQSDNCAAVASNFQGCDDKEAVFEHCSEYLGDLSRVQCLVDIGTPPEDAYDYCLRKMCYDDLSNAPNLGNC